MSANGLRPYPAYKDSGVEWLGKVPEHWEVRRLSTVAVPKSVRARYQHRELLSVYLNQGVIRFADAPERRANPTSLDLSQYQSVDPGDLVLNNQQAWRGSVGVSCLAGIVSPAYLVLSLTQRMQSRFADLLFRDHAMVAQYVASSRGVGSIQRNIYWPHLKGIAIPLPPLPEQRAIARFLDTAHRRIRRYIRAKERLIELLEERKRALIHEAVTGRIDVRTGQPYPAYKDSGVEWLGKVPEHWSVRRNRWLFRDRAETGFGSLPILEVSIHEGVRIRDMDDGQRKQQIVDRSQYKRARNGDIAYNTMRMWQGAVGVVPVDGLVSPAYVVACPVDGVDSRYYGYLLRTQACKQAVKLHSRGIVSDRDRLYWDEFKRIASPLPPQQEQALIVEFLDRAGRKLQGHISSTRRQIALLREYRTRLIADVVTGKLDVREAAADLPRTDPLAGNRDRAEIIPTESNPQPAEHDMAKEVYA